MYPHGEIFDTCVFINLIASDLFGDILASRSVSCYVVEHVVQESLYVRRSASEYRGVAREPISLLPYVQSGILQIVRLESEFEQSLFVDFAAQVDDGEAATLALAIARNWQMVTDNKKVAKLCQQFRPNPPCLSTLEIVHAWSKDQGIGRDEVADVLI